jgi:hypothetical protein
MRIQKQLNRHDPANGVYGDCHRTAIACVLDMDACDVPHFMDKKPDNSEAPECHEAIEVWLNARGLTQISVCYSGSIDLDLVLRTVMNSNPQSPGLVFLLGGTSRNKCNHTVVCCDGEIICDPSLDDAGIVGPMSDGNWWVTFFGAMAAVRRPAAGPAEIDANV